MYSEALDKDGHEYDKGDTHQENRPPGKNIEIIIEKISSSSENSPSI